MDQRSVVRSTQYLIIVMVLVCICSSSGSAMEVDTIPLEGTFRVFQAGQEVGTEAFSIRRTEDGWHLTSQVSLGEVVLVQDLEATQTGLARSYTLDVKVNGQQVKVEPSVEGLKCQITLGEQTLFEKSLAGEALILDNNFWSHYMLVIAQYDREMGGVQKFKVLVPQAVPQGLGIVNLDVELLDTKDGLEELSLLLMGQLKVSVWVQAGTVSIVKVAIPAQAIEATCDAMEQSLTMGGAFEAPSAPREVVERDVVFESNGVLLRGTLSCPSSGTGPWPAVVLVAGSGPTDRDGNNPLVPGRIDLLRAIAHHVSSNGFVVLRYDKRGVGASDVLTQIEDMKFDLFVEDVVSAYTFLSEQPEVIAQAISLAGHSEGALLCLQATSFVSPSSLLLLAGGGRPMRDILLEQVKGQLEVSMESGWMEQEELEQAMSQLLKCMDAVIKGEPFEIDVSETPQWLTTVMLSLVNQRPFTQKVLSVDPLKLFSEVSCPVLVVQGGRDSQISWEDASLIALAGKNAGVPVSLLFLPELDHVFKAVHDEQAAYGDPDRQVDARFLNALNMWLNWVEYGRQ
jgi:fermentation-respiration switch protein FrsA (DUF1100 family)